MPNKNPEKAKQLKHEWYMKNRETLLQRKREQWAAKKKLKLPRPPKPAPTPEQLARTREANRLACNRYRATHLAQVLLINRNYYHQHREKIVQQQRDRRARGRQNDPFRKLRALADVCAARLLEVEHGYTRIEPAQEKTGPREKQDQPETVSAATICHPERDGECEGPSTSALARTYRSYESNR